MADEVVLLDFKFSPFAMRVRIALKEKGIVYESREEDLFNKKTSLVLEMNPVHKKIPVLVHNGKPVCESLNIVQYIDEVWTDRSPFLPSDPYERYNAKFWSDFIDKKSEYDIFEVTKGSPRYFTGRESLGMPSNEHNLWPSSSVMPEQKAMDLSLFGFSPDIYPNSSSVSCIVLKVLSSAPAIKNKSSAKHRWVIFVSLHLGWYRYPFSPLLASKHMENTSMAIRKRYGDKGSPWRRPLPLLKCLFREPFKLTEKFEVVTQSFVQLINFSGKFISLIAANKKSQFKIYSLSRMVWTTKGETHATAKKELINCFKLLEGELGDKSYFGGESTFGYIDIALIPFYCRFYTLETFGNFSMNDECPKLVAWGKRCIQRESVSTTLCAQYEAYDFILEARKKLGVE